MNFNYILTFISGGFAGAIFKHFIDFQNNKIQTIKCHYIDEDTISKIPATFSTGQHNNLFSKTYKIINTTNRDIKNINITFTFDSLSKITKIQTMSKWGIDVPKGKVKKTKKNECIFTIRNFNRKDEIQIYLEIANLNTHKINIQESNCIGMQIKLIDKRKLKMNIGEAVKMVKKSDLS